MGKSLFKLTSLNLNGIRSAASKGVEAWVAQTTPDCICVQEVKAQAERARAASSTRRAQGPLPLRAEEGLFGRGAYSRHEPSDVIVGFGCEEFDAEGRYVELRFDTPARKLSIISCYFPSGSSGEERQQAKFRFLDVLDPHLVTLKSEREFILCGDVNIAHKEKDLKNWKGNRKNSGFLPEERAWMTKLLSETGLVDVYRQLRPDTTEDCYTWWSNRGQAWAKNVGWRLDYHRAAAGAAGAQRGIYKDERFGPRADHGRVRAGVSSQTNTPFF